MFRAFSVIVPACVDTFQGNMEHSSIGAEAIQTVESRFDHNVARTGAADRVRKLEQFRVPCSGIRENSDLARLNSCESSYDRRLRNTRNRSSAGTIIPIRGQTLGTATGQTSRYMTG